MKDEEGNYVNQADKNDESFQKYLAPYLKITHKKESKDANGNKIILYFLADGTAFSFAQHENRDIIFYPKNVEKCIEKSSDELKLKNTICKFIFEFFPISEDSDWKYLYKKGLEPYLYRWSGDEKELYTGAYYSCDSLRSDGSYCTAIIQHNNWKVSKDFPVKIKY